MSNFTMTYARLIYIFTYISDVITVSVNLNTNTLCNLISLEDCMYMHSYLGLGGFFFCDEMLIRTTER